ncbi:MAG: ATP-binding domain-containing protein, partial [Erysipelotrichia bacterium]|nr:ATP-binding domain-containing protein [Erysipelotrichia bacterium]
PRRGIGEKSHLVLKKEAAVEEQSLYEYVRDVDPKKSKLPARLINSLKTMVTNIEITRKELQKNKEEFPKILEDMIWSTGYQEHLLKEEDGDERNDNVKALFEDIRHFLKNNPESSFDEYLQNIALLSAQDEFVEGDYVTLMTVHTAKGLEYPVIFVIRLNQGVFPNDRSLKEGGVVALEEERRLAYVAMTRAKEKLYLTLTMDYSHVLQRNLLPSQFLKEAGNEILVEQENIFRSSSRGAKSQQGLFNDGDHLSFDDEASDDSKQTVIVEACNDVKDWNVSDVVIHKTLGRGVVTALEGDDIITVEFDDHGEKSVLGTHPSVAKGGHAA